MLQRFIEYKSKQIQGRSLDKFKALKKRLAEFFRNKLVSGVDEQMADDFHLYLAKTLAPATQKERLITLNAGWEWGIKQKLVFVNPWTDVVKAVSIPPTQKPKPFSQAEVHTILNGFGNGRYYRHTEDG